MESVIEFVMNNGVVMVLFVLAILTAVKKLLKGLENATPPGWLKTTIHVLERVVEWISANDSDTD